MDYLLSAVGLRLAAPIVEHTGDFEGAQRSADRILATQPACEAVEIFGQGRFLAEVTRTRASPSRDAEGLA